MNILLVFTLNDVPTARSPLRTPEHTQLGLGYISSLLQQHGHGTRLVVGSRVFRAAAIQYIDEAMREARPKVVGFSSVSSEFPFVRDLASHIKQTYPHVKLVLGGAHASLDPQSAIDLFDAVCIGEGEHPMLSYVQQVDRGEDPTAIKNMWLKKADGTIEKNPQGSFLQQLDELPHPDREMWEPWIHEERDARPSVLLGRGCPFKCTYCCHHKFRSLGDGAYVRFRNPQEIVQEIRGILSRRSHYKEIYLEQETIGVRLDWTDKLCDALESLNASLPHPVTFGVNLAITPNIDYDRLFASLKRGNVRYVNIGLESGSERLRSEVLKRKYSNEDVILAVSTARYHGLQVALFNMIGLPTETPEEFKLTLDMNRKCQPDWHYTSIFYPYPGTDLHKYCQEHGYLPQQAGPIGIDMERSQATLDLPTFPQRLVQQSYEWFDYNVYLGHKPKYRLLAKVVRAKLKRRPALNRFYRLMSRSAVGQKIDRILNPFVERTDSTIHAPGEAAPANC